MRVSRRAGMIGLSALTATAFVTALASERAPSDAHPTTGAPSPPRGLKALPRRLAMLDVAFSGLDGREIGFADLVGKPTVAVFWATWCGVCHGELPKLNRLKAELGEAVHVVALSIDEGGMPVIARYLKRQRLDALAPYLDREGVIAEMLGVRGVPTAYVLDAEGRLAAAGEGRIDWDGRRTSAYLAALA